MNDAEIMQAKRERRYALTRVSEEVVGDLVVRGGVRVKWVGLPKDAVYEACFYDWFTQSFTFKWLHKDFASTEEGLELPFLEAVCELLPREIADE